MSRVEENKEVVDNFVKLVDMNMGSGSYEELVTWHLGAIGSFLTDISKSLAVIADSMPKETVSERRGFME